MTGLAPAGDRFFNQPGLGVMLRKELGLAIQDLGGMGFESFGDLRVQLLPGTAQQATVRRVLHQRVLEAIDRGGRGRRAGIPARKRRCGRAHGRQAVEPRHQRVVQARRDRERRQCPIEHIAVHFLAQQTALQHALGQFLDKQRHAAASSYRATSPISLQVSSPLLPRGTEEQRSVCIPASALAAGSSERCYSASRSINSAGHRLSCRVVFLGRGRLAALEDG
jgi:hypothetical protein